MEVELLVVLVLVLDLTLLMIKEHLSLMAVSFVLEYMYPLVFVMA